MQLPIGLEDKFEGVVDLVDDEGAPLRAATTARTSSRRRSRPSCAAEAADRARGDARRRLDVLRRAHRGDPRGAGHRGADPRRRSARARSRCKLTPVFMGSAYKNKGVQLLLDGVVALPAEPDRGRERGARPRATTRRRSCSRSTRTSRSSRSRSSSRTAATASSPTCASTRARSRKGEFIVNMRTQEAPQGRPPRAHALRRDGGHRRRRRGRHRRAVRHRLHLGRHVHRRHGQASR